MPSALEAIVVIAVVAVVAVIPKLKSIHMDFVEKKKDGSESDKR